MIKELQNVLEFVRELPEEHQRRAAQELQRLVMRAEEESTMAPEEIKTLRRLESWRKVAEGYLAQRSVAGERK
jgi:hypothetical protein